MGGQVLRPAFPKRRTWLIVLRNGVRYLFRGAVRSWSRNLGTIAPALGSMTILLLLSGIAGLGWYTLRSATARASADAAVLHVYLRDDAKQADVDTLRQNLAGNPRVVRVTYVSKADALKKAARRPGLPDLTAVADPNPFPASFDLMVRSVQDVGGLAGTVQHDPAVDPLLPTSYEPGAYQRLQQLLTWVGARHPGVRLGTAVVVLPWHEPVRCAERIARVHGDMSPRHVRANVRFDKNDFAHEMGDEPRRGYQRDHSNCRSKNRIPQPLHRAKIRGRSRPRQTEHADRSPGRYPESLPHQGSLRCRGGYQWQYQEPATARPRL